MRKKAVVDFKGVEFSSMREMCRTYGVSLEMYKYRISVGWSMEKALTVPSVREDTGCSDHLGNTYTSQIEMCKAYGIRQNTFRQRIEHGWTLGEALTKKVEPRCKKCRDGYGNEFFSETEMCTFYNIDRKLYVRRKQLGWSTQEALFPGYKDTGKTCYDHKGVEYKSFAEMCRKYNIDWGTFKGRRERGWPLEDILTKEIGHICRDHLGREYESMTEMCKQYGISFPMFQKRILEYNWTIEEALTIPKNSSLGERRIAKYLDYRKIKYYHDITIKRLFAEMGIIHLYEEFIQELLKDLEMSGSNLDKKRIANMRFDFSLVHKDNVFAFIEYDGEQHFNWIDTFFTTLDTYLQRHSADEIKTYFAEVGGIPLLRIRYDQVDYIPEMIDDLLMNPQSYIVNHNTYLTDSEYWSLFTVPELKSV